MARRRSVAGTVASSVLAGIAGLHVAWGAGSPWPAADRARLADAVAGTEEVPPAAACFAVAVTLAGASALVAGAGGDAPRVRLARTGIAAGLLGRGVAGVTGLTSRLTPWPPSATFLRLDRERYGPLCLALGALVASDLIRRPGAAGS